MSTGDMALYEGDCLSLIKRIPDESVDLVLTDPPYGMAFRSNYRKARHAPIINDRALEWLPTLCEQLARVMTQNSAAYVFCSFHNIDLFKQGIQKHLHIKNILTWVKNNTSMGDLHADFAPKTEFIILAHKGRPLIRGKRDPNVFTFARTRNVLHPTQKPTELCEYLVEKFSDSGATVLDPFMGSGTTGEACRTLGRKFIGFELDSDHFATATKRLLPELSVSSAPF